MVDQTTPDEHVVVPFLRAGPPPDRTRWEGWQQWRKIRGTFVPAPPLTPAEYQSLSPRRRALHDLHRTATHVNMRLQETPMSARVANLMRGRLQNNAVKFMPGTRDGLMINGGGFQGKTETACDAAASFEDVWRDGQLPRGGLFIELADICGTTDLDLIVPGEARYLFRPSVDEDPSTLITTHRHGDSVQPTLLDGLSAADHHPQHTILIVDTLHQFIHNAHPGRTH